MSVPRDAIYFEQLARQARRLAAAHGDPEVARKLRETAIQHDKTARRLRREEERATNGDWLAAKRRALRKILRGLD